jgi:mRNA interferase RelE/StbE
MYSIRIKRSAEKQMRSLPLNVADKVGLAINGLAETPRPHGSKKLRGLDDTYRIRVADYRVVYTIEDEVLIVEVVKVAHRREVYR